MIKKLKAKPSAKNVSQKRNGVDRKKPKVNGTSVEFPKEGEFKNVSIDQIDISPLNYRKYYSQRDLENFASELEVHDIISPVTLRKMPTGRYELIVGERRFRAAKIAGLKSIPALIKQLSDEQVRECQLAENIQRENPHPMHEALAILSLQADGKSLNVIAQRLGRPKALIFSRLKLATLTISFQEMFLADVITLSDALQIAALSAESQAEFYETQCKGWQDREGFRLYNLSHILSQFRYDLTQASFDPKDKDLLAEAGACSKCSFNSATLKSLFPEMAKQAVCTNKTCYQKKADAQVRISFTRSFNEEIPAGLLFYGDPVQEADWVAAVLPEAAGLPLYNYYEITVMTPPVMPLEKDYRAEEGEDSTDATAAYEEALEEYKAELEEYNLLVDSGQIQPGLLIWNGKCKPVWFLPEQRQSSTNTTRKVTAKQVQEAIKNKTVTIPMIDAEKLRMQMREERSQAIDKEKIQLNVHQQFQEHILDMTNNEITPADLLATRLLIYQSLPYGVQSEVDGLLFPNRERVRIDTEELLQLLATLSDEQHIFLVRKALAAKPESKYVSHVTALCLYKLAQSAGVNTNLIEQKQREAAEGRREKQELRIEGLEKLRKKLLAAPTNSDNTEKQ